MGLCQQHQTELKKNEGTVKLLSYVLEWQIVNYPALIHVIFKMKIDTMYCINIFITALKTLNLSLCNLNSSKMWILNFFIYITIYDKLSV